MLWVKNYIGVNIKRIPHLSQTRKTGNLFDSLLHISPGEVYTTQTHLAKKQTKIDIHTNLQEQ